MCTPMPTLARRFWRVFRPADSLITSVRILGIDPGSRVTGYGVVDSDGSRSKYIASGCIRAGGGEMLGRLELIFEEIRKLINEYSPAEVAIENVFLSRNADSALKLGQARAAAICASFGSVATVHEYAARAVKQAVVGRGAADKSQVAHMVRALLSLRKSVLADEADALAVALCHAHHRSMADRLGTAISAAR